MSKVELYESALREAAIEAFEGSYEAEEISEMVNCEEIIKTAIDLILKRNNLRFG